MTNLFAEIYVPALDLTMDVLIPVHITVQQGIMLIAEIILKSDQVMLDVDSLVLYDTEHGMILNENDTFEQAPVQDACRLAII